MIAPYAVTDRERIAAFLLSSPALHLYEIGDLDDFFWPYTRWYGLGDPLEALVLVYAGASGVPTLLALAEEARFDATHALLRALRPELPGAIYAHLSPGLLETLAGAFEIEPHGPHARMVLVDRESARAADTRGVERLSPADLGEIEETYRRAYPGNWFDPRMLETGQYFAIREGGEIACVAGVHVYSPSRRVAAIGNVTTLPSQRRKGLARRVCARLCTSLLERVDHIGLNVKRDNEAAIMCYRSLGFAQVAEFEEVMLRRWCAPREAC